MNVHDLWRSELQAEGAVFADEADARWPEHFGRVEDEYAMLTGAAAVVDCSVRARIEIAGGDRATFLHNLCSNEVRKLQPGHGCEAFFLNAKGHIVGHGFILAGQESHTIESAPAQAEALMAQLDRYLIREDVQLHNRTSDWAEFMLGGPQAAEVLQRATGQTPPAEYLTASDVSIAGVPIRLWRVDFTLPASYALLFAADRRLDVYRALTDCGAHPAGRCAWETARVEAGLPIFGQDISDRNLPQEVARDDRALSFVKGCYIGQETVARIDALGHVNRSLTGVKFVGQALPQAGAQLGAAGQVIGDVTSVVYSPKLAAPLALAYVRRGYERPGTALEIDGMSAEVVALPV